MNDKKNARADEARAKIQNPRKERIMHTVHPTTRSGGFTLTLDTAPDPLTGEDLASRLIVTDPAGAGIVIDTIEEAQQLADALHDIAGAPQRAAAFERIQSTPGWPRPVPAHLADLDENADDFEKWGHARAVAIDCGVPGCDRSGHDWREDASEWLHWLEKTRAGRLEADVFVSSDNDDRPEQVRATVLLHVENELGSENELRALAAELRSYATIVERQVTALELHSTALKRSQR